MSHRVLAIALLLVATGCANRQFWDFGEDSHSRVSRSYHRSRGSTDLDEEVQSQLNEEIASQESPEHRAQQGAPAP